MSSNNSSEQNNMSSPEQLNSTLNEAFDVATNVVNQVITAAIIPTMDQVIPVVNEIIKGIDIDIVKNNQKKETTVELEPEKETELEPEKETETKKTNRARQLLNSIIPSKRKQPENVEETQVETQESLQQQTTVSSQIVVSPSAQQVFEISLSDLKSRLGVTQVTAQTIMFVVKYAMEVVEGVDMKGSEQREFALQLVRKVIIDAPITDEKEKLCLDMLDSGAIGQTMDLVIDATKGHLNINSVISTAEACCFTFLNSRRNRRNQRN
tara:strand:- start:24 stop:824 length:801 start_codon:yes stop_codon:yes gene_type:complete